MTRIVLRFVPVGVNRHSRRGPTPLVDLTGRDLYPFGSGVRKVQLNYRHQDCPTASVLVDLGRCYLVIVIISIVSFV
jgi:hypothetical protein